MVAAAPLFAVVAEKPCVACGVACSSPHNARFDYSFLKNEFRRLGIDFRSTVTCTVKLSRALYPEHHRHNLDSLIERHGLRADARHRALADAQLIHQFWQCIHAERSAGAIEAALQKQNAAPACRRNSMPVSSMTCLMHRASICSMAKTICRFMSAGQGHPPARPLAFSPICAQPEMALVQQVRRIDWIVTAGRSAPCSGGAGQGIAADAEPATAQERGKCSTWTLVDEGQGWLRPNWCSPATSISASPPPVTACTRTARKPIPCSPTG